MPITVNSQSGGAVITLSGEIDHHGARVMMQQMEDAIARTLPMRLTLDLSGVTFMDSSGIGVVLGRYRRMSESGGKLRMGGMSIYAEKILRMAGVLALLERK